MITAIERLDGELLALAEHEKDLHSRHKSASSLTEADATARRIAETRSHRVELLMQRNQAKAAEMRMRAAGMREESRRIQTAAEPHFAKIFDLEGIDFRTWPGRKSEEIQSEAHRLERDAENVAIAPPWANGNIRAESLDDLIDVVYGDPAIIPPSLASIESWADALERKKWGRLAPEIAIARQYHMIWQGGEITENSSIAWRMAQVVG